MKNVFFVVTCFILFSCAGKSKVPSEIIQPKEMQDILWDVLRAQALSASMSVKDSSIKEVAETKMLIQKVFEIHRVSSSAFDQSYSWYTGHPDVMRIVFDSMNIQNQRRSELRMKQIHGRPFKKDSIIKSRNNLK